MYEANVVDDSMYYEITQWHSSLFHLILLIVRHFQVYVVLISDDESPGVLMVLIDSSSAFESD